MLRHLGPALPPTSGRTIHDLASRLRRLPPSCGPVRLIAVDGHAGSGKSTFAGELARSLGGAPVLHLDDLACHDELFGWTDRLIAQVIEPLARGRARDGEEQREFWDAWVTAERAHFATDPSRPFADLLVRQGDLGEKSESGVPGKKGYEDTPGPAVTP